MEICHTLGMIQDYFTKALQGSQFHHFCNTIIGIHKDDILWLALRSEERAINLPFMARSSSFL